jgi:DNA-binding transcriptional MocR family regulator
MLKAKKYLANIEKYHQKYEDNCKLLSDMLESHLGWGYFVMHQTGDGMVIVTPTEGNINLSQVDLDKLFKLSSEDAGAYLNSFASI